METTINYNDAFRFLAIATKTPEDNLSNIIYKRMLDEGVMYDDDTIAGQSVLDVFKQNGYENQQIINTLFPKQTKNEEIILILDRIVFLGTATENPCPLCGCECDVEKDGIGKDEWNVIDCQNGECDYSVNEEPDWDVLPGGYDNK